MTRQSVARRFGDAGLAAVEQIERGIDRLAHRAFGLGTDLVAGLEGVVDDLFEAGQKLVGWHGGPVVWPSLVGVAGGGCQAVRAGRDLLRAGSLRSVRGLAVCMNRRAKSMKARSTGEGSSVR